MLVRSMTATSNEDISRSVVQAETLLRRSVEYVPENRLGWRGLGFALAVQGQEERAVIAWQNAGEMAEEFIQRGKQAQRGKQYQEALKWYRRAIDTAPELADSWFATGLTYEEMSRWEKAMEAYVRAADARVFINVGRSSPYFRQGMICQWRVEPRRVEAALLAYETAIEIDDFSDDLEAANCHYQRGEILRWTERNPDEYIVEYQRAIDLYPDLATAYVYLGVAYYTRDRGAARAEAEIQKALMLEPRNQWAYYHLGEIYRQEGRIDEAIVMYKQALDIAPDFEIALEQLQSLPDGK